MLVSQSMMRTAFKRKAKDLKEPIFKKVGLKRHRPKMTPIRKAARGQECTLCIPGVCNHSTETTVLCHSNYLVDGKGMGLKAPDTAAAFGCSSCHDVLDGRAPRPDGWSKIDLEAAFYEAVRKTHEILRLKGLL